jgi:hypothetical protein
MGSRAEARTSRAGFAASLMLLGAPLLVLAVSVIGSSAVAAQAQVPEAMAVVTAYEMARNRGDLDVAVTYFADDGTLTQRSTTYTGRDEIRRYLQAATARGRFVVISNRRLNGNQLTWTERPASQNVNGVEVTVEAVVQDGKIKALAYNGTLAPARSELSVDGRAQLPALLGMASVVLLLGGLILLTSTGLPHTSLPQSRLRGRLMQDLQVWRAARTVSG